MPENEIYITKKIKFKTKIYITYKIAKNNYIYKKA